MVDLVEIVGLVYNLLINLIVTFATRETMASDPEDIECTSIRGTQREYSSKPLKHNIVERILTFKR